MHISVIIPTHNRSEALDLTLEHLAKQEFAGEWEAVVVNNNSMDDTAEVIAKWQAKFPVDLRTVDEKTPGPAAARNAGAKAATGEFLVFIDNDILVDEHFLSLHIKTLRKNPGCWFIGRVKNPGNLRDTPFGRYRDDLHESSFVSLPPDALADYDGATGQNWAMRREEFLVTGGFDESYPIASCEDAELALRARRNGYRTMFNPRSVVIHNDWAIDIQTFCRRQELYSIPSVLLWTKYGDTSIQLEMVRENGPISWNEDSLRRIGKKSAKGIASKILMQSVTSWICRVVERFAPDSGLSRKAYRTATALAIFRGVREGFKRYGHLRNGKGDTVGL